MNTKKKSKNGGAEPKEASRRKKEELDEVPDAGALVAEDTLSGLVEMLSKSAQWAGVLAWNDFEQRIVFRKEAPFGDVPRSGEMLTDEDIARIRLWYETKHQVAVKKQNVVDAVRIVAFRNRFHPVSDYLKTLKWDRKPRIDTWLEKFVGVQATSEEHGRLVRNVARKWLVSCVARAMKPGCKVDTMLILEGKQGIGKSRALAALAGDDFFCDSLIDFRTKDASQNIQGVWIYELSELDALLRSETSTAKAFLTRSEDKFRAPYARTPMTIPRSTVFAGTINHGGYLKDHTGNRRFWVVRCGETVDVEGLAAERDQLWAEARALFEQGEPWHLDDQDEAMLREEHEERLVVDPWREEIAQWVSTHGDQPFAVEAVLEGVLKLSAASRNPTVTRRVHHILEQLGFERQRRSFERQGHRVYRYVRVGSPTAPLAPRDHHSSSKAGKPKAKPKPPTRAKPTNQRAPKRAA